MPMEFTIQGHENTLSEHKTTLEFTKDEHLSKRGDCILGVNATFSKYRKGKKLLVEITTNKYSDSISGYRNTSFTSTREMVLRKSNFEDARTYMIHCNKAAKDIDRKIITHLQHPNKKATVSITPITIKNIIFDFDNTLEDWQLYENRVDKLLGDWVIDLLKEKNKLPEGVTKKKFATIFRTSKLKFIHQYTQPRYYGRDYWLREALRSIHRKLSPEQITDLVRRYWKYIDENVTLFPETISTLKKLQGAYKLLILSDSDGDKGIKMKRINKFHLKQYFNGIYTSDDTKYNKPHIQSVQWVMKKTKINPHETMFVGDHPETDLITSKELGMSTVWIKKGEYASAQSYPYVDFEIEHINDVMHVLKQLK